MLDIVLDQVSALPARQRTEIEAGGRFFLLQNVLQPSPNSSCGQATVHFNARHQWIMIAFKADALDSTVSGQIQWNVGRKS